MLSEECLNRTPSRNISRMGTVDPCKSPQTLQTMMQLYDIYIEYKRGFCAEGAVNDNDNKILLKEIFLLFSAT